MSANQPLMDRKAWLVAAATVLAFSLVVGASVIRDQHQETRLNLGKRTAGSTDHSGVQIKTALALRQTNQLTEVVATVSILNTTDKPIAYVGSNCYDPADVEYESTRPIPAGPAYAPSAAALRAHIMEYRRSVDTSGALFTDESRSTDSACDRSSPPLLQPHKELTYTLNNALAATDYAFVDSATTDVVTKVQLGRLIPSAPGLPPTPIQPTEKVEVRSHLQSLGTVVKVSDAQFERADHVLGLMLQNPALGSWIGAQDPALWRDARLTLWSTRWSLEAYNHRWASPLLVDGDGDAIKSMHIPSEPWAPRPTVDAVLPAGVEGAVSGTDIPYQDIYAGDLVLPSGKVMVGDPVYSDGMLTFDYGLKPGLYPVHVVTARPRYLGADYARPTWEELLLTSGEVTHWQPAIPVGHSSKELQTGRLFSFSTDGGTGGFASPEAMKLMDASLSNDALLYTELGQREQANDWAFGLLTVDPKNGANVFACESGFGDGGYGVIVGLDAQNKPAALLADFGVLDVTFSGLHS